MISFKTPRFSTLLCITYIVHFSLVHSYLNKNSDNRFSTLKNSQSFPSSNPSPFTSQIPISTTKKNNATINKQVDLDIKELKAYCQLALGKDDDFRHLASSDLSPLSSQTSSTKKPLPKDRQAAKKKSDATINRQLDLDIKTLKTDCQLARLAFTKKNDTAINRQLDLQIRALKIDCQLARFAHENKDKLKLKSSEKPLAQAQRATPQSSEIFDDMLKKYFARKPKIKNVAPRALTQQLPNKEDVYKAEMAHLLSTTKKDAIEQNQANVNEFNKYVQDIQKLLELDANEKPLMLAGQTAAQLPKPVATDVLKSHSLKSSKQGATSYFEQGVKALNKFKIATQQRARQYFVSSAPTIQSNINNTTAIDTSKLKTRSLRAYKIYSSAIKQLSSDSIKKLSAVTAVANVAAMKLSQHRYPPTITSHISAPNNNNISTNTGEGLTETAPASKAKTTNNCDNTEIDPVNPKTFEMPETKPSDLETTTITAIDKINSLLDLQSNDQSLPKVAIEAEINAAAITKQDQQIKTEQSFFSVIQNLLTKRNSAITVCLMTGAVSIFYRNNLDEIESINYEIEKIIATTKIDNDQTAMLNALNPLFKKCTSAQRREFIYLILTELSLSASTIEELSKLM